MKRSTLTIAMALTTAAGLAGAAPSIDGGSSWTGWTSGGNSLTLGNYVRGDGVFAFDMYSTAFSLSAGSGLLGGGWQEGDAVLALGGSITQGVTNNNLSQSVRIVTKFGTDATAWSASTFVATGGNGQGSFSGGAGGDGAILLGTDGPTQGPGNLNPTTGGSNTSIFVGPGAPGAGNFYEMPLAERYNAGSTASYSTDIGKLIFLFDANNILSSWQVFLNQSMLSDQLGPGGLVPELGDRAVMTLQRSTSSSLFTDSLITVVPTPGTAGLLGLAGLAALRRRR